MSRWEKKKKKKKKRKGRFRHEGYRISPEDSPLFRLAMLAFTRQVVGLPHMQTCLSRAHLLEMSQPNKSLRNDLKR